MEYRKLGQTGLKVSELALGTMQFGWTADESVAFAIMDTYVEVGLRLSEEEMQTLNDFSDWRDT